MISFKSFKTLVTEARNMSADQARAMIRQAVDNADGRTLINLMRAVERPILEEKSRELFRARKLDAFGKRNSLPFVEFVNKVSSAKGDTEEKLTFIQNCIDGVYFDANGFTRAKSGNFSSYVKAPDSIMKQLYTWFLNWKPQIDANGTVAVGRMEAVMIFLAADGGKGGDGETFGDAFAGGNLIEVKTGGGHMGKGGKTMFGTKKTWFINECKKQIPDWAGSKSDKEILAAFMGGAGKPKNTVIVEINEALKKARKKPSDFWKSFFNEVYGQRINDQGILDDPNLIDLQAYATGLGFIVYKQQTNFDMVSVLSTTNAGGQKFGDFVNWHTPDDCITTFKSNLWSMDYSLSWDGGGRVDGLSPRLYTGKKGYTL
jgi:hypothetical protein|tara:strand:- start:5385 stop:6503 length:1119 start_codon:yes stop_codon:yes gene_type:complete